MDFELGSGWLSCGYSRRAVKYKYKYNSYFYCAPYSLTDGALQKSASMYFIAVGGLK